MAVTYKLMHLGTRVGEWPSLDETANAVPAYLAEHADEIESLRLVGFITSFESGAKPAFTIAGPDIVAYLTAATTVLTPLTEADDAAKAVAGPASRTAPGDPRSPAALTKTAHPSAPGARSADCGAADEPAVLLPLQQPDGARRQRPRPGCLAS
jgi:hypothetical protein